MPKHIHIHKIKNKNKNKNTNTTNVHIHLNHKRQYVRRKQTVKKEVPTTPTTNPIRTFTPLHQFTNFVPIPGMPMNPAVGIPIPQYSQMASHPQFPVPSPLVQHNPLVNPLRDISGRNRTIQDVINDRTQLREMQRKQHEEEIQKRIQEHDEKKKQDRSQTLFEVQTKGNFESLPLFSPFASSAPDQEEEEEEDPFFRSVFKKPPSHEVAAISNYSPKIPAPEEEEEEEGETTKQRTLSPVEERSEEEDEPPPPPVLKLKKSLSDEEMKEQLDKIKTLSDQYKQGVELIKEHVVPQPEEEPFVPEFKPTFSSDPSFFDTTLGKTIYTGKRGAYYYFTKDGNKKGLSVEDTQRISAQKQPSDKQKVSFTKLESKLDTIINQSPLRQRAIEEYENTQKTQSLGTLGEWAKRKKEEKQQPLPEATQVSTPESSAMPIAVATEVKGRTDYNKEENIYLRQSDRDRLRALEAKKSNKTITEEEKTEMTNLKAKRRRNKAAGKTYT